MCRFDASLDPMRTLVFAAACIVLALAGYGSVRAALDGSPAPASRLEVLVFEHAECTYCRVFRRDVLPRYQTAGVGRSVPLRFVDIERSDTGALGLRARIDTVPTAVVMRDGAEVDRIVGYWGPDNFFKLLAHIISRVE